MGPPMQGYARGGKAKVGSKMKDNPKDSPAKERRERKMGKKT